MTAPTRSRLVSAVLLVTTLVTACSVENATPYPHCTEGGSALIVAQSVTTATLLPCLRSLPDGWTVQSVSVNQDGTIIRLDSDRAGEGAATLRFVAQRDTEPSVATASEHAGATRFDDIQSLEPSFRARTMYLFDGGCVAWEFDFDQGVSAAEAVAIRNSLTLVPREVVNDSIRATFVDEEL